MKLSSLVSEEQLVATWIELEIVNFAIMADLNNLVGESQVLNADG